MFLFGHVSPKLVLIWALFFLLLAGHVESKASGSLHLAKKLKRSDKVDVTKAPACVEVPPAAITAPKANVWGWLNEDEVNSVVAWLLSRKELNLTAGANATDWSNFIRLVEIMPPNKTDTLPYLDKDGKRPEKYARVVLDLRATDKPQFADILVGPLPVDKATTWQPLTYTRTRKEDGGRVRNIDDLNDFWYHWLYPIGASVADITRDLFNGSFTGANNDTIYLSGTTPYVQEADGSVIRFDQFYNTPKDNTTDPFSLLPLGLHLISNVTGRDPSKWSILGWVYNDVFYKTTEEFRTAHRAGKVVKMGINVDGDWTSIDRQGPVLPMDTVHPPVPGTPGGARFSLDRENMYVEWMGFSFYMGWSQDLGLSLHDIRYKGERLLYELGLQEALAHYAGSDPYQANSAFLDSAEGFGWYSSHPVKGFDVPSHATCLNVTGYEAETTSLFHERICLYEFDLDYSIERHEDSYHLWTSKNTQFTVRWIATVDNYDYMFSYTFSMDGSMTVEVRASGYIIAAYSANEADYGFKIHDFLSGSLHDHVMNFKADFDIAGTDNSVQLMKVAPVTKEYSWSRGQKYNTMQLERHFVETEDQGRLDWDLNSATQVLVVNEKAKNAFGENRGYRIQSLGTTHLTVLESTCLQHAAHWSEHDLHVTRQKDTEPWSSHPFNLEDSLDPPVNFERFLDGESLRGEDLVVWLNLGMHHVPHSGDLPNTVFSSAHSGVRFVPSNYFTRDQSRQTVNMVRLDYNDNGTIIHVETFGQANDSCLVHA